MDSSFLHCASCQRRLPDDSTFCPQCGHKTTDAVIKPMKDPPTAVFSAPVSVRESWQLTLVRPDGEQVVFPFSESVRIGRSTENDLPLQDHQISRYHALIEKGAGGYQISDLGSTNGTFVNRKRIMYPMKLRVGDTITIGQFRILVQRDSIPCGNCGLIVKSDYVFCAHCGDPLTGLSMVSESSSRNKFANLQTNPFDAPNIPTAKIAHQPAHNPPSTAWQADLSAQADSRSKAATSELKQGETYRARQFEAHIPAPSQSIQGGQRSQPRELRGGGWWIQACAIAFVVGLCTLAALAAAGYWLYAPGFFIR